MLYIILWRYSSLEGGGGVVAVYESEERARAMLECLRGQLGSREYALDVRQLNDERPAPELEWWPK